MNQFYGMDKFLGLKIIRLEDELSRIRDVRKWKTTEKGYVYYDTERKKHKSTTKIGIQMSADYKRRKALINEINELRLYWKENHGTDFNREEFKYTPKPLNNKLEKMFGNYSAMQEEPNTHKDKIHHNNDGKDYDSKSEMSIGNILKSLHIDYKIHIPLHFQLGEKITVDFVIYLPEIDRYIFLEHCGKINFGNYNGSITYKEETFYKYNIIPHRDVFFTYEDRDNPATYEYLETMIKAFINSVI